MSSRRPGIVRPTFTYGSIAFAHKLQSQTIKDKLKSLQRLALTQIAKVRPSTPTSALEIIYNVPPLDIYVWEVAQKTALRIGINPTWIPHQTQGHQHQILDSLPAASRQCLDDVRKTILFEMNYSVEIEDGKDIAHRPDWSCYTDGSVMEGRAGSGSIILQRDNEFCSHSYSLGERGIFHAEISAIINSVNNLLQNKVEYKSIYFLVDSQAALKSLKNPESKSDFVREAKNGLNILGRKNRVTLRWIEAHKGYKFNEVADKLAKKGASPNCLRQGEQPLPNKRSIFALIEEQNKQKWFNRWITSLEARQSKYFWQFPSKSKSDKILSHPREVVSRVVRFTTGHAFLRRQNAVVFHGFSPPPGDISCRLCEDPVMDETPHHLITECEALVFRRMDIFGTDFLDEFPPWKPEELIRFLENKDIILLECD